MLWLTKMQKFTPREALFPPGGCPSAEDLAAYIDGTLGKAESERITGHLASCEDCYTVYSETLHFQLASSAADPAGEVVPFPTPPAREWARRATRWLPIAALLLIGIGSGSYLAYFQFLAAPKLATIPPTPPLASLPTGTQLWVGPTYRGGEGEQDTRIKEASFRMGVQLVNLQATLQAGKAQESQDIIARILNLLKPQPFTDDLYKRYVGITTSLDKRPPTEFLPEAVRLAKESRDVFDTPSLDLGQWVETAYLATLEKNPSFFQQSDNRAFLRRLRWSDKLGLHDVKLDPATRASLDRISDIISKSDLRPSDYTELQHGLEKILGTYYPMS